MVRRRPQTVYLLALACLFAVILFYRPRADAVADEQLVQWTNDDASKIKWLNIQRRFWRHFRKDLYDHRPQTWSLLHPKRANLDIPYVQASSRPRPDALEISSRQTAALRQAHSAFVGNITARQYDLPYRPGTRGIVTTAGRKHLAVALVSLRMLRLTGSILPVEVMLADRDEVDVVICDYIFPPLNASCVVLEDIIDPGVYMKRYQFKMMAILFSTFEEVLFLDSDCFPLSDPESLFSIEAFTSTGLLFWPDFWFASESPSFFQIANMRPPMVVDSPSIEAGQIMYSKSRHELSILLSMYYNYYGPEFYYPLQSQGAQGEGDKQTYPCAAFVLGEPYHIVKDLVHALGYWNTDGDFRGSAMLQFDPTRDLEPPASRAGHRAQPLFLHVNFPKIDPGEIFLPPPHKIHEVYSPIFDADLTLRRIWFDTPEAAIAVFGFDAEKAMWREVWRIACEYEGMLEAWLDKENLCQDAMYYYSEVFVDAFEEENADEY